MKRFQRTEAYHRICRRCRRRILRTEKWHTVQIGWFAPWYCCEHWNCGNASAESHREAVKSQEPELPFEDAFKEA
jgi:hypothetical protein